VAALFVHDLLQLFHLRPHHTAITTIAVNGVV
jgi:hypothetical protein